MRRRQILLLFFAFGMWFLYVTPALSQVTFSDWIIRSGTTGWDIVNDITIDTSGNVYITGCNTDTSLISKLSSIKTNSVRYHYIEKYDTSGTLIWHKKIVSTDEGYGGLMTITADNHLILAGGSIQSNTDGKLNNKKFSFFLSCIDVDGEESWTQSFNGTKLDYLTSLTINPVDQTIQLAGYFRDTLTITQGEVVSTHRSDAVLLNFESSGQFKNMQLISGIGDERINAVAYDIIGYRYLTGTFQKKVSLGDTVFIEHDHPAEDAVFIAQFNRSGELQQGKKICAGKDVKIQSIVCLGEEFFIAGCFGNVLKADNKELFSAGSDDVFILCLDNKLNFRWIKHLGGDKKDRISDFSVKDGNLLLTGSYSSELSVGQIKISPVDKGNNIFVLSLDTDGNVNWTRSFGGPSDDYPKGMMISPDGYIYITGSFKETVKVANKSVQSNGEEDVFIARLEDCNEQLPEFKQPEVFCEDGQIVLDVGAGFSSYNWGNGLSYTQFLAVDVEGDYSLELIAENGCVLYDTIQVVEVDNPDVFIGNDTTIMDTSTLVLTIKEGYSSYLWNNGVKEPVNIVKGSSYATGPNIIHVIVTNEDGCIGEDEMILYISKTDALSLMEDLSSSCFIYPNPTPDEVNVYFTRSFESLDLKIYNQLGVVITEKKVDNYTQNSSIVFHLESLPTGLYTLIVTSDSGFAMKKIVLQ